MKRHDSTTAARGQDRPIDSILIDERHRRDHGDVAELARSIASVGTPALFGG